MLPCYEIKIEPIPRSKRWNVIRLDARSGEVIPWLNSKLFVKLTLEKALKELRFWSDFYKALGMYGGVL